MKKKFRKNICIVEKDASFEKRLARGLAKYSTHTILEHNILNVLELSQSTRIDVLIVGEDIEDRLKVSQQIINKDMTIAVVFICKDEQEKKETEQFDNRFHAIVRPFTSTHLNEYINNIKSLDLPDATFDIGRYTFDYNSRKLSFSAPDGNTLGQILTKKEAGILLMLASNRNQVVLRSKILNNFWYAESYNYSRSMDVYMTRLRGYLSMDKSITIENIHAKGYKISY